MNSLIKILIKKKLKISFAESCTGGLLASSLTSISGASKVFNLGLITYSNQSKVKVLKVNTLINRGKLKSFKGSVGYKKDQKKAIVTLSEGNTIDSSLEIK